MQIHRLETLTVIDCNRAAVKVVLARNLDDARRGCPDRLARCRAQIQTTVIIASGLAVMQTLDSEQ